MEKNEDSNKEWNFIPTDGNPKESGMYLVTYIDRAGNYDVSIKRWQDSWWMDNSVVIAWKEKPKPFPWSSFKHQMNEVKKKEK